MSDRTLQKFFGFQTYYPEKMPEVSGCYIFFLLMKEYKDTYLEGSKVKYNEIGFYIDRELLPDQEYKYTEEEVLSVIEQKCQELPLWEYPGGFKPCEKRPDLDVLVFDPVDGYTTTEGLGFFSYTSMKTKLAIKTRRGTRVLQIFPNVFTYVGTPVFDRPIIISKHNDTGKYGVLFHPRFLDYGFRTR